jgi:hypothetical protein
MKPKRIGSGNQFKQLAQTHITAGKKAKQESKRKSKSSTTKSKAQSTQYKQVRNERRKAERRISAITRQLATTESPQARQLLETRINNLQRAIEQVRTYSPETGKRIHTKLEVEHGLNYLKAVNEASTSYARGNKAQNKATEIEIKRAGKGGMYTMRQVQLFYKETMPAWNREDVSPNQRNQAILAYYGEQNLAALFDRLVNESSVKDLEKAREILQNPNDYSDEDKRWAYDVIKDNDDEYIVSPNSRKNAAVTYLPVEAPGL